jgi:hypothetical protein
MPLGFGQNYWVQVVYQDGPDLWVPVNGSRDTARDAAALWLGQPGVDFVLVLAGSVRRGACPKRKQILDEFNRMGDERAQDCRVYRLKTKAAKRVMRGAK